MFSDFDDPRSVTDPREGPRANGARTDGPRTDGPGADGPGADDGRGLPGGGRFPAATHVRRTWERLAQAGGGGGTIPARTDLDPRLLGDALRVCFIAEHIVPGQARLRVTGRHLGDLFGMEPRGMPVGALFAPASRREAARLLELTCRRPALTQAWLESGAGIGRGRLEGTLVLAPLLDEHGQITRLLGAIETIGHVGRAPRRFEVRRSRYLPCPAPAGAPAVGVPGRGQAAAPGGLPGALPGALPEGMPDAQPARARLRLVVDNG